MYFKHKTLLAIFLVVAAVVHKSASLKPEPGIDTGKSRHNTLEKSASIHNEIEVDDRIQVIEPYKSLIQTSVRFALAQTDISRMVELDTAMDLLSDVGFLLSKPSTLLQVAKAISVVVATIFVSMFFFPGAMKHLETLWHHPSEALNLDKVLSNGISERSVLSILGSNDALSKVGLYDSACRERSVCQMGEIIHCAFPETAEVVAKFVADYFSRPRYRENKYYKAFMHGFGEQNCTRIGAEPTHATGCIGDLFSNLIKLRWGGHSHSGAKNKYQTLPVRAK